MTETRRERVDVSRFAYVTHTRLDNARRARAQKVNFHPKASATTL